MLNYEKKQSVDYTDPTQRAIEEARNKLIEDIVSKGDWMPCMKSRLFANEDSTLYIKTIENLTD